MKIALVGGTKFLPNEVDRFLLALQEKHPNATLITGEARGSEKHAAESARLLGFKVEVPALHPEWYGEEAPLCQINDVLIEADVIVTMGVTTGGRAKRAIEIWKRCDTFNNSDTKLKNVPMPSARTMHHIAAPPKTERSSRRASKPMSMA